MKKIFALLIAMMMVLSFAACAAEAPAAEAPAAEAPAAEATYDLVEDGKLLVATSPDFAPFEFIDTTKTGQEQFIGFDIMLAKFVASELGLELEIKPMDFNACQTAVQMKAVDMSISGYSWTPERAENFCLSDKYFAGDDATIQTIIVPADKADSFDAVEDFAGMKIGAQAASLQETLCNENLADIATIELFKDINDAVLSLKTGKIDAIAVENSNGMAIIANNPEIGFSGFIFEVDEESSDSVIMLNKDSEVLTAKVNEILAKAKEAGYYGEWYEEAKALAKIDTNVTISFDEEGNAIG